jgi:hypothetical protein
MRTIAMLVACIYLAGCATTSHVALEGDPHPLERGDKVTVTMRDGTSHPFEVAEIRDDAVCSPTECLRKQEIAGVERSRIDTGRTLGAVMLVIGVVGLAALIAGLRGGFPPGAFN